jgi:hypothetical protein
VDFVPRFFGCICHPEACFPQRTEVSIFVFRNAYVFNLHLLGSGLRWVLFGAFKKILNWGISTQ